jgi:hypothetical protein
MVVAMSEPSAKVLAIRMLESVEDGTPIEIQWGDSLVSKRIPNGRGLSRMNVILKGETILEAELITEKI